MEFGASEENGMKKKKNPKKLKLSRETLRGLA
jgi:hypothetical protein